MSYQQDASRSEKTFLKICAAPLKEMFKASAILSTAPHKEKLDKVIDFAGVDYIVDSPLFGLVPIQGKVSFGNAPYRNFVIRRSRSSGALTDYDKLNRARKFGTISPLCHVAVFADNDDDDNADAALVYTADLLNFIDDGLANVKSYQNGSFFTCDWQRLEDCGVKLFHLVRRADSLKEAIE